MISIDALRHRPARCLSRAMGRCALAATGATMIPSAVVGAQSDSAGRAASYDSVAQAAARDIASLGIPGLAVAIVEGERVVYAKGFGVASAETGAPLTADMLFRVGSLSKVVAALTVVSEAKERGIPLTTPIGRSVSGLAPAVSRVTLDQLLSHTAGIEDEITATPIAEHADPDDLLRDVRSWTDARLFTQPGEVMSYSNLGYELLAAWIESVSGKRFPDVVAQRVFEPLGLTDATYSAGMAVTHPFTQGHLGARGERPTVVRPIRTDVRHLAPTFLWASAIDLARLEIALMNHGRIDGRQALDSAVVATIEQPRAPFPGRTGTFYGYGLIVNSGAGSLGHTGRLEGFGSSAQMFPSTGRGYVELHNRFDITPVQTLAALRSGQPPLPVATNAHLDPADFTGRYVNGTRTVVVTDSTGTLWMVDRGLRGTLAAAAGDNLLFRYVNDQTKQSGTTVWSVVRDAGGRVKYLWTGERALRRTR